MNNIKWETSIKKKNSDITSNTSPIRVVWGTIFHQFISCLTQKKSKKLFEQQQITSVLNINHICFTQVKKKKKIDYFSNSAILGVSSFILEFSLAWLSLKFLVFFTSY